MWNNRKILIGKKPVFYQTWYDAGITKISDILNQNQKFLKWHEFVTKFNLNVPFTHILWLGQRNPKRLESYSYKPYSKRHTREHYCKQPKNQFYLLFSFKHRLCSSHCRNQNSTPRIYKNYHQERLSYAI